MKYSDGIVIMEENLEASYSRRIVKDLNYEIRQHPFVKMGLFMMILIYDWYILMILKMLIRTLHLTIVAI